jgi:hypothetical protein
MQPSIGLHHFEAHTFWVIRANNFQRDIRQFASNWIIRDSGTRKQQMQPGTFSTTSIFIISPYFMTSILTMKGCR